MVVSDDRAKALLLLLLLLSLSLLRARVSARSQSSLDARSRVLVGLGWISPQGGGARRVAEAIAALVALCQRLCTSVD